MAILSCWEPCGGILCANLPIVYKSFVELLKQVGSTVGGGSRTQTKDSHSRAQSQSIIYNNDGVFSDWQRLNNSGIINDSKPAISTHASADTTDATEMDNLGLSGIVVQRDFTTEERRRSPVRKGSDTDVSSSMK